MSKTETDSKIRRDEYVGREWLQELRDNAAAAWDEAGEGRGPWNYSIDVADLTKLCDELLARRAADE